MSTYIIGDIHGCYDELMILLNKINYCHGRDRLIFVGDLINRGPDSLKVLRFIKSLGGDAQIVLGNHDISLIAYYKGIYKEKNNDFDKIIKARDIKEIIFWLRQQPLLIKNNNLKFIVTHAGIPPCWSIKKAVRYAKKTESRIRDVKWEKYLRHAYKKNENVWSEGLSKLDKFRYIINAFTRMRYCNSNGDPDLKEKAVIGKQSYGLLPWFLQRKKQQMDNNIRIFFGHWASLGYYDNGDVFCLDSGCVWGGRLSAVKVKKSSVRLFSIKSLQKKR